MTQDGWAARLGYGRATIHRWEHGESVPGAEATEALITLCREQGLLRRFERGRLSGLTITAELLRELLAEARLEAARAEQGGRDDAAPSTELPFADAAPRHNLPIPLSSFIGRETELRAIKAALGSARLLTLTGAGGCGKTRLALRVGFDLARDYADGVWLVDLAPLADPDLLPHVVAATLGVAAVPDEALSPALVAALVGKDLLLLLDNCEHLIHACARLAEELLRHCPRVRVLATSREPLGIAGEVRWPVPPLAAPPEQATSLDAVARYDAARLFLERARSVLPTFRLAESEAPAVARICRRLDGLPLALELAAPLVVALPVDQIADRLDRRFQFLLAGSRTALPRHQTLAALVSWSYDLLDPAERALFHRLAVFAGSFSLEAVEEIGVGDGAASDGIVAVLLRLVAKSLVVPETEAAGRARYRLLETLRQFGWEKLQAAGEAEAVSECHARYYLVLAEEGERGLRGRDQVDWLWRLEADHDNLRAALTWLDKRGRVDAAVRFAGALAVFWAIRGYYAEGRAHLERLLARPEAAESWAERGKALWGLGRLADRQGDFGVMRACFEESRACAARAGDRETIIRALIGLGKWAVTQDDRRAGRWLDEALARAREFGELWAIAAVLGETAVLEASRGDLVLAQSLSEEWLDLARQTGDAWQVNFALHMLGSFVLALGDDVRARALFDEKMAIVQTLGDRSSIANTLGFLGQVDVAQGTPERARARFEEGLAIYRDRGDQDGIAFAAGNLCELTLSQGDLAAARAFAAECLTAARVPGAEKLATALLCNGDVALAEGDISAAEEYFADALALLGPAGRPGPTAQILQGFARVAAARNQPVRALRLVGRAAALRGWNGHRLASIDLALLERALRPLRDAPGGLSLDEQEAARAEGEAMTPERAYAYALERGRS